MGLPLCLRCPRCPRRCLEPAGSSCRRRREPGRTGSRSSWHGDPARLSGCDLPSVAPTQPPCPELASEGELPACPAGRCHVPSAHMPVPVSLGCAGSATSGTRAQQSCRCVTVPGLQGDTAPPALGRSTLHRAMRSSGGCCLWLGCSGPFPPPQVSASPGDFCSSEGRKRHPQPLEDAVSAPVRLRLLWWDEDPMFHLRSTKAAWSQDPAPRCGVQRGRQGLGGAGSHGRSCLCWLWQGAGRGTWLRLPLHPKVTLQTAPSALCSSGPARACGDWAGSLVRDQFN